MDIQINNNIDNIKPKVMGPFTGTQLICVSIAVGIEAAGAFIIKSFFPDTIVCYIIPIPFVLIPLAIGWAEDLLHMTVSDYWELVIKRKYTYPTFRPYTMHNYLETLESQALQEIQQEKEELAQQAQKNNKHKKKEKKQALVIPEELKGFE